MATPIEARREPSQDEVVGLHVHNPADGSLVGIVPLLGRAAARDAVDAAAAAFPGWRATPANSRAQVLVAWSQLLIEHADELATLMTREQGKPVAQARAEILQSADYLQWYAEQAKRIAGELLAADRPDRVVRVLREPVGVVAAITPWNFPTAMIARKAGAAIAAGCTVVLKPAESTPLSAIAMAKLGEEAGLPEGVLTIVTGDPVEIGAELTSNPTVRKLTFTGSTAVGRLLARQCADTLKRVTLELGGNNPFIVFQDADLDAASEGLMAAKFRNAGQVCVSANRVLVHEDVQEAFLDRVRQRVRGLSVGPGLEPGTDVGPLIDDRSAMRLEALVREAVSAGARLEVGGHRHPAGDAYFEPTLISGLDASMTLCGEELFGPVAAVSSFRTEEEAVSQANSTPYGLVAYAYTDDRRRANRLGRDLEAGMVAINDSGIAGSAYPFGGVKESGYGREGSVHGLDDYLEMKLVCDGDAY